MDTSIIPPIYAYIYIIIVHINKKNIYITEQKYVIDIQKILLLLLLLYKYICINIICIHILIQSNHVHPFFAYETCPWTSHGAGGRWGPSRYRRPWWVSHGFTMDSPWIHPAKMVDSPWKMIDSASGNCGCFNGYFSGYFNDSPWVHH